MKSLSCLITLEAQRCETCFDCHHKACKNTPAGTDLTIMWILSYKIQCCLSPTCELMLFILGIGCCRSIGQLCIILSILMYLLLIYNISSWNDTVLSGWLCATPCQFNIRHKKTVPFSWMWYNWGCIQWPDLILTPIKGCATDSLQHPTFLASL